MGDSTILSPCGRGPVWFLFLGLFFVALAGSANATTTTVICPASIQTAVNGASPGDTIQVSGTCTENIQIIDRIHLTIRATALGNATIVPPSGNDAFDLVRSRDITFENLIIDGLGASSAGITLFDNSQAVIKTSTIRNHIDLGVFLDLNSRVNVNGSTLQNNGDGMDVTRDSLAIISNSTITNSTFEGVFAQDRSSIQLGSSAVSNNGDTGVVLFDLSRAGIGGTTTIDNNVNAGIVVAVQCLLRMGVNSKVRNNGASCVPGNICGGITAVRNSTIRLNGAEVSGNTGNGIELEQGIDLGINDSTIANNSGIGVNILRMSIGDFIVNNTFSGNGVSAISCDATSLVTGDVSAVPKKQLDCKQIDRPNGAARPGKVKEPKQ